MKPTIDMMEIGKHITLTATLKNVKRFTFRASIAILLIRLAGRIIPINYHEKTEEAEEKRKEG